MFDRNNFKAFVERQESFIKPTCFIEHPTVQYHAIYKDTIWSESFRTLTEAELSNSKRIGSLKDPKINRQHYIDFSDYKGEYWTANYKIATNFYPYHSCDIYQCQECNRLFAVYTENSGHFPQRRIREIKKELIVEEPHSCVLELSNKDLDHLANYLKLTKDNFKTLLETNKNIERINTSFGDKDIIISQFYKYNYLVVGNKTLIYHLVNLFNQ